MRWLRRLEGKRVVVHTRDDRSVRGALTGVFSDCVILDGPEYLHEAQADPLAGRAVIPRDNVAWFQEV